MQRREWIGSRPGPHLLITGGVHGDEFEPMAAIRRLIRQVPSEILCGQLTLVPVVNEGAFTRGTRCGEDEADLARVCPGRPDGSITERVAYALAERIQAADYYIDLHTGGTRLSVLPMTGYVLHPDPDILNRQRQMAHAFNLPLIWGTDFRPQGRSLSVARDAGVPAIYAEHGGAAACEPGGIEDYVQGCLNVMGWLGLLSRPASTSNVAHVIEDPRPDSGHMQLCHPAPVSGFFEPVVQLGQHLQVGDPLGTISNILGDDIQTVLAQESGILLTLRTFASVNAGDALAVIAAAPD